MQRLTPYLAAVLLAIVGCDDSGDPDADAEAGADADADADVEGDAPDADPEIEVERPPLACLEPEPLGDGPYFTDVTEDMGLGPSGMNIQGGGVVSSYLDDDRWPDLVLLRRVATGPRDDPEAPRFDTRVLLNEGGEGFEDASMSSGLLDTRDGSWGRPITLFIFADLDNDGDTDAYSGTRSDMSSPESDDRTEILLGNGDGTFSFGPEGDFSDDVEFDPVYGATFLDADLDGVLDLFVGQQYLVYGQFSSAVQDSLYRGVGDGSFEDVTEEMGLRTEGPWDLGAVEEGRAHRPTWGVSACDVDWDGRRDLLVSVYGLQFNPFWHAQEDGTFVDIGIETGFASDDNLDYSDNLKYQCHCHEFGGDCDPMPPPPEYLCWDDDLWGQYDDQPWRLGGNNSSALCGDLDRDGDLDVVTVVLDHEWAGESTDHSEILVNEGVGTGGVFERPGREETGFTRLHPRGWNEGDLGGALLDFDNDGLLDILILSAAYPDTYSLLYRQEGDGRFDEVGRDAGVRIDHGLGGTVVDYDRDGDYDLVIGTVLSGWETYEDPPRPDADYMYVLRNDVGQDSNRVMVHLEGAGAPGSNRSAIGARIEVRVGDELILREVAAGEGHDAYQHDLLQIIGVGDHCEVDSVTIRWPNRDQTVTTITDVPANYVLVVREGEVYSFATLAEYVAGE